MANIFATLPAVAANGTGAWVDVSGFGALKTITYETSSRTAPYVVIEGSNETVPSSGYTIYQFVTPGEQSFEVAAHWMRVRVTNYIGGPAPDVELGGTDGGASFAQATVPVGDGVGPAVDVSSLGLFKTVQVLDAFRGNLTIEISEDGGATFAEGEGLSFQRAGFVSSVFAADFVRVKRNGVPQVAPGTPEVWIGAADPVGGGGGGGVIVQENEVDVVNPATTLDFQGPGILAQDFGGGVAGIYSTLLPVVDSVTPTNGQTFTLVIGSTNPVNSSNVTTSAHARLPPASTMPNGTMVAVQLFVNELGAGEPLGLIDFVPSLGDTLEGDTSAVTALNFELNWQSVIWVSDGASNWTILSDWTPQPSFPDEQAFIYTATGAENPAGFPVSLPVAMDPGSDYVVEVTMGEFTDLLAFGAIVRTSTTITMAASAALTVSDELLIIVKKVTT